MPVYAIGPCLYIYFNKENAKHIVDDKWCPTSVALLNKTKRNKKKIVNKPKCVFHLIKFVKAIRANHLAKENKHNRYFYIYFLNNNS